MTSPRTRIARRALVGLALGAVLATYGVVGTVLGAKPIPAITSASCTTPIYDGSPDVVYTRVSWEGLHPKSVVFTWNDTYTFFRTVSVDRPKGSQLAVPTPGGGVDEVLNGTVTVYGPSGIELQSIYWCNRGY